MSRGAYVGRFQPFHKGHLRALKWILEREEEVVLVVGSAQYSHTRENPFTLGERLEMIWRVLKEEGILERVIPVGVPDTNKQHNLWVQVVLTMAPRFDRVYSNDPMTRRLFKERGFEVRSIPFFDRDVYCATRIREKIARGEEWEELVPPAVAEVVKSVGGVERIRELYGRTGAPCT